MTAAPVVPAPARPVRALRVPLTAAGRMLRLELRRNVMPWLLPLTAGLFWFITYRPSMAYPPMWNLRAMTMQGTSLAVLVPTVVGAAAWLGSREGRHGMAELVSGTARPRWFRQLAAWAATTCWAVVAYLGCVGVLYGVTARQAAWGGPLWWPVVVGVASLPAFSALGFVAGALRPSRFTPPLVAVAAFLAFEISAQFIHGDHSYWQVSPLVAGPWEIGPDEGVATFYPYLPDLPIAQVMFLAGLTAALLGALGVPAGAGGRWLRGSAAATAVVGLVVAATAVGLAGTGRLDVHGMIAIPALHDAADDDPIRYSPVCSRTAVPVCLHPAYAGYLPVVVDALEPVLREVAGLPGAPARISQVAATYRQDPGNGVRIGRAGPPVSGTPPVFHLVLPSHLARRTATGDFAAEVRATVGRDLVDAVVGGGRGATPAQQAVADGMLRTSTLPPGSPAAAAARRFAALPAAARHAWLVDHLAALRTGDVTLGQLP
ncbi:hypothetical protein ONA91_23445 [Micromonospora sp. DR5-3]|uniref:hypothetical protein n=1 Tax=unclassified Micromonospora TaxID=2617518 RepID=UPI0011D3DD43|nr:MULTISPECIES: hypothetical protein [unclassified Micromonospora]MCW3817410.1 hypothetical protein [Micromonospora sp. DR5-3]TYC22913.1 hypothetical protein FXF52_18450 [Micromonospora sp. MP36]